MANFKFRKNRGAKIEQESAQNEKRIIRDYEEFVSIIKELENDKKELLEDNIRLKQEIRSLKTKLEVIKDGSNKDVSNVDLLRRLSNLEKIIYGDED